MRKDTAKVRLWRVHCFCLCFLTLKIFHKIFFKKYMHALFAVHVCSVMSVSLWPFGMQPTRLLCPWDFSGDNSGLGCHFLLWGNLPEPGQTHVSWVFCIAGNFFISLSLSHQHFHEKFFELKNDSVRGNQWKVKLLLFTNIGFQFLPYWLQIWACHLIWPMNVSEPTCGSILSLLSWHVMLCPDWGCFYTLGLRCVASNWLLSF